MAWALQHLTQNCLGNHGINVADVDVDRKIEHVTFWFEIACNVDFHSIVGL